MPLTEAVFAERFQEKWGDQLLLVPGSFAGTAKPIEVICPKHGQFTYKRAGNILGKTNIWPCSKCKVEEKTQAFIEKARKIHGDKYDYSKSIWSPEHVGDPIIITCPTHGDWPSQMYHVKDGKQKGGCPQCGLEAVLAAKQNQAKKAAESFEEKARKVHGDKYSYEKVDYGKNNRQKVEIFCKKHQKYFEQQPNSHLNGRGCPDCAIEKMREDRIPSIEGKSFGRLTAIRIDHTRKRKGRDVGEYKYWLCKCSCGKEIVVLQTSLIVGQTKSCGCLKHDNFVNQELSGLHDQETAARETEIYFVEVSGGFQKFGVSVYSAETRGKGDYEKIYWRYRDRRDIVVPVEMVIHEMTRQYFDYDDIANAEMENWPGWTELRKGLDVNFWINKAEQLLNECTEMGHEAFIAHYMTD